MEERANESEESNGKNKSKSYFDLYPNISQKSKSLNGANLCDKMGHNNSSSK